MMFSFSAFAGIFDAIVTAVEDSGIEIVLDEMKQILKDTQKIQSENIGNDADADVYRKLAEFYEEMEKNSVNTLKYLWDFGVEAAQNGGDQEFWEMKAADFISDFRNTGKIPGTDYTVADVTKYIKLKGISKEAKMKYLDEMMENMRKSNQARLSTNMDDYLTSLAVRSSRDVSSIMTDVLTEDEAAVESTKSGLVSDLNTAKGRWRNLIGILIVGLGIGLLGWGMKQYFSGDMAAEHFFIRIIVGAAGCFVGLSVLFM